MSIVSKKHKFVFLPILKTATTSLNEIFAKEYESFYEPAGNKHHCVVPLWAKDYFVFTVVRNPYQRTFSLWKEILRQHWWNGHPNPGGYREFIENWLVGRDYPDSIAEFLMNYPQISLSITQSLQELTPHILRFENLQEDFNQLPFLKKHHQLPHLNVSKDDRQYRESLIAENIHLVNKWCREDFENFGYRMLSPIRFL